jgi:hypothetical protein
MMTMALLVGLCVAAPAAAEEPGKGKKQDDSYGYIFHDDILKAGGHDANSGQITVVKAARRDRLLRPRLHFVPEMLKSVEAM